MRQQVLKAVTNVNNHIYKHCVAANLCGDAGMSTCASEEPEG